MVWTWTIPVLLGSLFASLSVICWWLFRQRRQRVWLPTVRVLKVPSSHLSDLRIVPFDFMGLLLFLGVVGSFLFFLGKPGIFAFSPTGFEAGKTHIFIDMSPSVSSVTSAEIYADRVADLWAEISQDEQVVVAQSGDGKAWEPQSRQDVYSWVLKNSFHREGLKIGEALHLWLQRHTDAKQLIVVSDRDEESWKDFEWRHLEGQIEVHWYPAADDLNLGQNHFIYQTRRLSNSESRRYEWDIDITRRIVGPAETGKFYGYYQGREVVSTVYQIAEGNQKVTIRVQADLSNFSIIPEQVPIVWKIESNVSGMAIDDEFRSYVFGYQEDAVLVADPFGENSLEDPVYDLNLTLNLFGFRIKRLDRLSDSLMHSHNKAHFWLVAGGGSFPEKSWCPRFSQTDMKKGMAKKKVWLFPEYLTSNYQKLCSCSSKMTQKFPEESCQHVKDAQSWLQLLYSSGGVQIGGAVGDLKRSMAVHIEGEGQWDMTAFAIPLRPQKRTGLSHSQFPLTLRTLLRRENILKETGGYEWPRVSNIVDREGWGEKTSKTSMVSNIPLGESLQKTMTLMPTQWTSRKHQKESKHSQEKIDYQWGVHMAWWTFLFFSLCEILWSLKQLRYRSLLYFAFLSLPWLSEESSARRLEIPVLGSKSYKVHDFASALEQRTSLSLEKETKTLSSFDDLAKEQPWLWVDDLSLVLGEDGSLHKDVVDWVKDGGLLILQQGSEQQLAAYTKNWFEKEGLKSGWSVIPPDHELMISFYLLNALPSCYDRLWSGFRFDHRLAILYIPAPILDIVADQKHQSIPKSCHGDKELWKRTFVNIHMVALTLDYKKDQTHMKEVLKRL